MKTSDPPRELGIGQGLPLLWRLGRQSVDAPQWFLGVIAACLSATLWVLEPWIGKTLIDLGLRDREEEAFMILLGTAGALAAIAYGFDLASRWLLGECERRASARLHLRWSGTQLETHSMLQAENGLEKNKDNPVRPGRSEAGQAAAELICLIPARSVSAGLQLLLIAGVLSHFRAWLGVVALGGWSALFFVSYAISRRFAVSRLHVDEKRMRRESSARRLWLLRDWLRLGRRSDQGIRSLAAAWESWRDADGRRESWESALATVQWGGNFLLSFSLAIFCGFRVIQGELSLGEYVAIQVYLGLARAPAERLASCWKAWASARSELKSLAEDPQLGRFEQSLADEEKILERDPSVLNESSLQSLAFARSLRLQSTRFWDGEIELDGVMIGPWGPYSLRLARGSRVLVLAPLEASASEKALFSATLRQVLSGAVAPRKGVVRIGGRDLREMPQAWIRRWAATVPREPTLFAGTLREQLLFDFLPSRSDAELRDWLARLELVDSDLERWIQPEELSIEEGQKVSLGRALLQKPGLLLLEENLPLWSLPHAARWNALIRSQARTVLAFGESEVLLNWVDSVWIPKVDDSQRNGTQFAEPLELETFLQTADLERFQVPGSLLARALESRALESQWRAIEQRFSLSTATFEVHLQGEAEAISHALPTILSACREAFRDADLVSQAGLRSFRLICLGADARAAVALFERLFGVLSKTVRTLRTEGKPVLSFHIRKVRSAEVKTPGTLLRPLTLAPGGFPVRKREEKTG